MLIDHFISTTLRCTLRTLLLILLIESLSTTGYCQKKVLNIPAIHQLVDQSKSENKLQVKAKDKQAVVTANERANLTLLEKMKVRYRELQRRYNTIGLLIDATGIALTARPMVSRIVGNQQEIVSMVRRNPALLAIGFDAELMFADKAGDLLTYLTGLTLAIGDVNQMRTSDRKMLFDFAIQELSQLQDLSGNLLAAMQYAGAAGMLKSLNPFQDFVDMDIQLGKEIIENARYLK